MGFSRNNFAKICDYIIAKFKIISSKFRVSWNFKMLFRSHPNMYAVLYIVIFPHTFWYVLHNVKNHQKNTLLNI